MAISDLPKFLQTADNCRMFLNYMQAVSRSMGRYFTCLMVTQARRLHRNSLCKWQRQPRWRGRAINRDRQFGLNGNPNFNGIVLLETVMLERDARATVTFSAPPTLPGSPDPGRLVKTGSHILSRLPSSRNGTGNADLRFDSRRCKRAGCSWEQSCATRVLGKPHELELAAQPTLNSELERSSKQK